METDVQTLTNRQIIGYVALSIILILIIGVSINIISNDATIFIKFPQTMIYFILSGIVWYNISPTIIKKIIHE